MARSRSRRAKRAGSAGAAWIGAVLAAIALAWPAAMTAQEVLAARTLRSGTVLGPADLTLGQGDPAQSRAAIAGLVGLEARRVLYAGRPVMRADLGPPTLVHRNTVVVMVYADGALGIRTEGRALDAGGEGEQVRVMNLVSRQPVIATVTGAGRVEVQP